MCVCVVCVCVCVCVIYMVGVSFRMYNKESLILALLDKSNLPEVVSHIQSLKVCQDTHSYVVLVLRIVLLLL